MARKINRVKSDFSNVFVKEAKTDTKITKYLGEYVELVPKDAYFKELYARILRGEALTERETERLHDLMLNVDLAELLVDKLLGNEGIEPEDLQFTEDSIYTRIKKVMEVGIHRLHGWDQKFIFGETGTALYDQCQSKGGWLSDKQLHHLKRIEGALGI